MNDDLREMPLLTPNPYATPGGSPWYVDSASIARLADRDGPLPVSFGQRRLWFLDRLAPGRNAYVIADCAWLSDDLDVSALQGALAALVRRHEVLRTIFSTVDGEPVQVVLPVGTFADVLEVLPAADDPHAVLAEWVRRPFDLVSELLLRAVLVPAGAGWLCGVVVHHIASDGWSMGVLLHELRELYADAGSVLPPISVGYADYAVWQHNRLADGSLNEQVEYWLDQLDGAPAVLELPFDRLRPAVRSFRGGDVVFDLDAELTTGLAALAESCDATLFMCLLALFVVLLVRYSGQIDVVVGVPVAGRERVEFESIVGFFANTLALRVDAGGDPSFAELVRRVREAALGGFAHQDVPFEVLVERLSPQRELSYNPVFQVMFALQNAPGTSLVLPGVDVWPASVDNDSSKFDLSLDVTEVGGRLSAVLEYDAALFDRSTVEAMSACFTQLCRDAVEDAGRALSDLSFVDDQQRDALVALSSGPDAAIGALVHERVTAMAEARPDAVAVECGDQVVSYAELNRRATQLAGRLARVGAGPETLVAVFLDRCPELVVALLAVLKSGAGYVPVDAAYPTHRVEQMIADAHPVVVLTRSGLTPPEHGHRIDVDDDEMAAVTSAPAVDLAGIAYIGYTSGSTGTPKGVAITHAGLANHAGFFVSACDLDAGDRVLQFASLGFDTAVEEIWPVLSVGGRLVLGDLDVMAFHRLEWVISEHGVTVVDLPTAYWSGWAAELADGNGAVPASLRTVVVGGERLTDSALRAWRSVTSVPVCNSYGPTETTVIATFAADVRPADHGADPTIGRPLPNVRLLVLGPGLDVRPVGVPGELFIGGVGVARGYWGQPGRTAERFVPDPYTGGVLYRTGDRARLRPDRGVEFLGRVDRQVKIRGFRVEPGETEAVLRAHPAVREAVVVPAADNRSLLGYLTGDLGTGSLPTITAYLRERLPDYLVPTRFAVLARFPLTPHGKVDIDALSAVAPPPAEDFEPPRGPTEERLAGLIAALLDVPSVGRGDNFFRLGGHSLLAARLVARIGAEFGVDVPLREVFAAPDVARLAEVIAAAERPVSSGPAVQPSARVAYALSLSELDIAFTGE